MSEMNLYDILIECVKHLKEDNLALKARVQENENDIKNIKNMLVVDSDDIDTGSDDTYLETDDIIGESDDIIGESDDGESDDIESDDIIREIRSKPIENIWYMNGNHEDMKIWDIHVKNKTLLTWNQNGKNESIKKNIKKNDIIVWYVRAKGFNSILKVNDTPTIINRNDLHKYYPAWKHKYPTFDSWMKDGETENYERIRISVEFLATTNTQFVNQTEIPHWNHMWSGGLRGSYCIKPNNPHWKEQVIEIYKYINKNHYLNNNFPNSNLQ